MELQEFIGIVQQSIKTGRFTNEAAVSQGIVVPILRMLGWPDYDTQVVCPQFALDGKRVDYALCHPAGKPKIFIEVKQVGQGVGADKQLFEYAFHTGVPMAVLTDGQEWNFYLPAGEGAYQERRVYKLDFLERENNEIVQRLNRYLSYQAVRSGEAKEYAIKDYTDNSKRRQQKDALPKAWIQIIKERDELLLELLSEKVADICGMPPEQKLVVDFLENDLKVVSREIPQAFTQPPIIPQINFRTMRPKKGSQKKSFGFILKGKEYPARNANEVMINALEILWENDKTFLDRFAARKHGRKRRYIALKKEELYPDRPDLCNNASHHLKSGWWVGTNYSDQNKEIILQMACEVAGLKYGKDLIVTMG